MTTMLPPLPALSGGRERARSLVNSIADKLEGSEVWLDCRQLVLSTSSFADQLVMQVLEEGKADKLIVTSANVTFAEYLRSAASEHNVLDRLMIESD